MGRRATGINLLAFSIAMLSQRSYRGNSWVSPQVASECTSLNGLFKLGLPAARSKQSLNSHSKDSQLVSNFNYLLLRNSLPKLGRNSLPKLKQNWQFVYCNHSEWCKVEVKSYTRMTENFMPYHMRILSNLCKGLN